MKIEMLVSHYATASGFKLVGQGEHEVSDERGQRLLDTYPTWFKAVEGDSSPTKNNGELEEGQNDDAGSQPTKPVSKMNKDELTAYATELGIEVNDEMTNDQLKDAIKANQEG